MPPKAKTKEEILQNAVDRGEDGAYDYDLVVIGGGSGGLAAAKRAADHGAKVALCDFVTPSPAGTAWGLGGTCVNVGCIPKKLMHTAGLMGEAMNHAAPEYGWKFTEKPQCSWEDLAQNVTMHIKSLNFGYSAELRKREIKYLNAYATFVDPHTIECKDKKGNVTKVTARRFLLATGGRPSLLDIPGKEHAITSDDVFRLNREPGKTLVVGASYVALECAGFLTGIGRDATVMMRSIPLRGFDQQMAGMIVDFMETQGTKFIRKCVPSGIVKKDSGKLAVSYKNTETGEEVTDEYDTVLMAVGRVPETSGLNLPAAGVTVDDTKRVVIDEYDRTSAPNIYAIGDIVRGGLELTPVAIAAGRYLADRLYHGGSTLMSYEGVPTTVFTPLEYGAVGLSEEAATEKYGMVEVYHSYFTPLEWTVPHLGDNVCYMKIIVNPFDAERVLGFHILSPNAGEITQGVAVALKCGATKAQFDATIGIHPVIAEEMTQLTVSKSSGVDAKKSGC